ncbi:nucleotidyltransferase domain-containing protein [Thermococcus sp.]
MKVFSNTHEIYIKELFRRIKEHYGDNLLSLVVFGSYARGNNRYSSDMDLLIILKDAPRVSERIRDFIVNVEEPLEELEKKLTEEGIYMDISPLILTSEEALNFSPLYLDILENHVVIYDRGFFKKLVKFIGEEAKRRKVFRHKVNGHNVWEFGGAGVG